MSLAYDIGVGIFVTIVGTVVAAAILEFLKKYTIDFKLKLIIK